MKDGGPGIQDREARRARSAAWQGLDAWDSTKLLVVSMRQPAAGRRSLQAEERGIRQRFMRQPHPTLTPQELAIMKLVWQFEQATVRDVYEALRDQRPVAYTTVMTMMRILEEKGYLERTLVERAHVYRPTKPRQQVLGAMVRDFVDRVFDGAPDRLLLHLAKDNKLTAKQRRIVKQLIDEIDE